MTTGTIDSIAPSSLILPTTPTIATKQANAVTGQIEMSGAACQIFDGTNWKTITYQ